jgi:6-pyruvoyltetrahydropterin/6-carboxytetrahydropterin synthase
MFSIGKRFTFDAAHVLHGLPDGHKCGRLHGHTYTVEVQLTAEGLQDPGFVTDFADLAPFGRYLDEQFDHRLLNDVMAAEPTSEALAALFFAWCAQNLAPTLASARVTAVRVSETPSSWAEFRGTPG